MHLVHKGLVDPTTIGGSWSGSRVAWGVGHDEIILGKSNNLYTVDGGGGLPSLILKYYTHSSISGMD